MPITPLAVSAGAKGLSALLRGSSERSRAREARRAQVEQFRQLIESIGQIREEGIERGLAGQQRLIQAFTGRAGRRARAAGITSPEATEAIIAPAREQGASIGGRQLRQIISQYDAPLMRAHEGYAMRPVIHQPGTRDIFAGLLSAGAEAGTQYGLGKLEQEIGT